MLQGLLGQKLVHKQDHLASVNRQHELYASFQGAAQQPAQVRLYFCSSELPPCTLLPQSSTLCLLPAGPAVVLRHADNGGGILQAASAGAASERATGETSTSGQATGQVSVVYCYRVPSSLRPVLGDAANAKDDVYTELQIRDAPPALRAATES